MDERQGALTGVRVLDTTSGIAGPVATMFFADFGADVVKVEPPGGARDRGEPGFAVWNRNKRSVAVDLTTGDGQRWLGDVLEATDVLVTNGPTERLTGTLLDPEHAAARHQHLVHLHVPLFLDAARWAGDVESEGLLAAITGVSRRQSSFDGGPIDAVFPLLPTIQGAWAAAAGAAALVERERSGRGQAVTVGGMHGAMVAAAAALTFAPPPPSAAPSTEQAPTPRRRRGTGPGGNTPFYRTYRCADGQWLFLAALTAHFSELAFKGLGLSHLYEDPRLEGRGRAGMLQPQNSGWVIEAITERFASASRDEWLSRLYDAGCPAGPVLDQQDWLDHPQIAAIGMRVELEDPERGHVVMPGVPLDLHASPGAVRTSAPPVPTSPPPAPADLWQSDPMPRATAAVGSSPDGLSTGGPLDGIRVLDLGAVIAGPFAGSLLAELGADVVKVEPLTGDSFRGPGFAAYNKGQRGVALDLRHPDGHAAFIDLVRGADVVIDNYRPGVLGRLEIGWDDLAKVKPEIVSVSITGFGDRGPMGNDAGFDPVLQAMSGMMAAQGGDSDPVFFTVPVNDVTTAATVALATSLALFHRARKGVGQKVVTSLAATSAFVQAGELVRFDARRPPRVGGRDHTGPGPLDRYYETSDGWIRLVATHLDDVAERLVAAGVAADPAHITDVQAAVAAWSIDRPSRDAAAALNGAGIAAAVAQTSADLVNDPEIQQFGAARPDPRPGREGGWTAGRHARFTRTERTGTLVAPALGEHTREVLASAGLSSSAIAALIEGGAATEPAPPS